MSERHCKDCMYFKKDRRNNDFGWCRRHAPRPITYILTDDNVHEEHDVRWPQVAFDDFCGELEHD